MQPFRIALITAALFLLPKAAFSSFKYFDPAVEAEVPATISAMGLYKDLRRKILADAVVPYDVNTPLWSDGAAKTRFILLPTGTSVGFNDSGDYYEYPDRAVFIKNFFLDTIQGQPASRILWETRVMINKEKNGLDLWYGFSYQWNRNQSDATLVPKDGLNTGIENYYPGRVINGEPATMKKWTFPSRNQCIACHANFIVRPGGNTVRNRTVLGFFTAQLNKTVANSNPSINQIQVLFQKGVFGNKPSPTNFSNLPQWRSITDESAPLGVRAKSYIASNCSGCHGTRAILNERITGFDTKMENTLNYDYHDMVDHMDYGNKELTREFENGLKFLLWPGQTEKSTLWFRQTQRNMKDSSYAAPRPQMPPLGSFETDSVALAVIKRWIDGMPLKTPDPLNFIKYPVKIPPAEIPSPIVSIAPSGVSGGLGSIHAEPIYKDGVLHFTEGLDKKSENSVALVSVDGGIYPLRRQSNGTYSIPNKIGKGIYFVTVSGVRLPSRIARL